MDYRHHLVLVINIILLNISFASGAAPIFGSGAYAASAIDEGLAAGTTVTLTPGITATDGDGDVMTFSITGANAAEFVINGANTDQPVVIKTARAFDFEAGDTSFSFTVSVNDGTSTVVSNTITLTINNLNDNSPICNPITYFASLAENSNIGDPVVTINGCTDSDAGTSLTYSESTAYAQFQFPSSVSGAITLQAALDYETATEHKMFMLVSDGDASHDQTATVVVTVTNVNEGTPTFGSAAYAATDLDEELSLGAVITITPPITATDADGDTITFSLSGADAGEFLLDGAATEQPVVIKTARAFDYDAGDSSFTFTVTANDGTATTTSNTITLSINNLNDNPPVCNSGTYFTTLPENSNIGDPVVTITGCTDPDSGTSLTYTESTAYPQFEFPLSTSGAITLEAALDYETDTEHTLYMIISDGDVSHDQTATVVVTVTNINEGTPTYGSGSYAATNLDEEPPIGTTIVISPAITATDADGDTITFSLAGANAGEFVIDGAATDQPVVIKTARAFDYESGDTSFTFTVTANDGTATTTSNTITLNINDLNDNSPVCNPGTYFTTVAENSNIGDPVVTITGCTDADAGTSLTYTESAAYPQFQFPSATSGAITLQAALDYETDTEHTLYMVISDGDASHDQIVTVIVTVNPVNEGVPIYGSGAYAATNLNEGLPIGTSITVSPTIIATDADGHTIIFSLGGANAGEFVIDGAATDQPVVIKTARVFDYDAGDTSFSFNIGAYDGTSTVTSNSITLAINDLNDNAPVCNPAIYFATLDENANVGDPVVTITGCTDPDSGTSLTYTESTAYPQFQFASPTSGAITIEAALDYETDTEHTLYMVISDGDVSHDQTVTVIVTVNNVNEGTPTYGSASYAATNLDEGLAIGTVITISPAITATDADGDTITFSLAGANAGEFVVDGTATDQPVVIKTARAFDFDAGDTSLTFTVNANDGTGTTISNSITLNINDLNDNAPVCNPAIYFVTLAENANVGDPVVTITGCTDPDAGTSLTYTESVAYPQFQFASASSGAITLQAALDYETDTEHTLYMVISDGDMSHDQTATVIVTVNNVNEGTPTYGSASYAATNLDEGLAIGTVITITPPIIATDADGDTITFTLAGANAGEFVINGADTDQPVVIKTARAFDYDAGDTSLTFMMNANDGTATTTSNTITLSINDLNDNAPLCNPVSYFVTLPESHNVGDPVVTITGCTDPDTGTSLTYAESVAYPQFEFASSTSGAITLQAALDYETDTEHTLYMVISDGDVSHDQTVAIVVTVNPVDEGVPTYGSVSYAATNLDEGLPVGTPITISPAITATDADGETITFSLGGADAAKFVIDGSATDQPVVIKTARAFDFEAGDTSFSFNIGANDGTSSVTSNTISLTINDLNDNPPVCNPTSYFVNVAESSSIGDPVVTITGCTDPDAGTSLTYTESVAYPQFQFASATSGAITLQAALDYETNTEHTLYMVISDGDASHDQTVTVIVTVTNVNEGVPIYGSASYAATNLNEELPVGTVITISPAITATDADGDTITFSLGGANAGEFVVDGATTAQPVVIKTARAFDYDTGDTSFTFTVNANDGTATTTSNTITLTINDLNDNAPLCNPISYFVTLPESHNVGDPVVTITGCTDADAGTSLTYSESVAYPQFGFPSATSGALTLQAALDYETDTEHTLHMVISDGDVSHDQTVTIVVTVNPVDEGVPTYGSASYAATNLDEELSVGTIITISPTIIASDADGETITFSLGGANAVEFVIDGAATDQPVVIKTARAFDYDAGDMSFSFNIGAYDGTSTVTSNTITLTINDLNDNPPVCNPTSYFASVAENINIGDPVVTINGCTDPDAGTSLTYTESTAYPQFEFPSATSGSMTIEAALDYETDTEHTLYMVISDGDVSHDQTATVVVTVTNVNEGVPTYGSASYAATNLNEESPVGTVLTITPTITATDADGDTISFSLAGTNAGDFVIAGAATDQPVVIKTARAFDYDAGDTSLTFTVNANDGTGTTTSNTITLTINDLNDNAPVCNPATYFASLSENSNIGDPVVTITGCTDPDAGTSLTYTESAAYPQFQFPSATSGAITLQAALDYEADTEHTLYMVISDGDVSHDQTATVVVTVNNFNEGTPTHGSASYAATNLDEGLPIGTTVTITPAITATDADGDTITFSLAGADAGEFVIGGAATDQPVVIKTARVFDYDAGDLSLSFTITANDGTATTTSNTITLTINDLNDNAPVCNPGTYFTTQAENSNIGDPVVTITGCTDADAGTSLTYAESVAYPQFEFALATSGAITLQAALDYETDTEHVLYMVISDGDVSHDQTVTVVVTVSNVNEGTPTYGSASYAVTSLNEGLPVGTVLTITPTISATDADGDAITFSLAGANAGEFAINGAATDQPVVIKTLREFDYEAGDTSFTFTVNANDGTAIVALPNSLTVNINDLNDNPPVCNPVSHFVTLPESHSVGNPVVTITGCTDTDAGTSLTYTESVAYPQFEFPSATSGAITLQAGLDYETATDHTLYMVISDGDVSHDQTVTVVVTVNPVDEGVPTYGSASYAATNLDEGLPIGTIVTISPAITATDADGETIAFSLGGADAGEFVLNGGATDQPVVIKTARVFDYDAGDTSFSFNIGAYDGTSTVTSNTITLIIDDVNDNAPVCNPATYFITLPENSNIGDPVVTITGCTDADAGTALSYTESVAYPQFQFGSASSGAITLQAALDYETDTEHTLYMVISDGDVSHDQTATVIVMVTNVNEGVPTYGSASYAATNLNEELPVGTVLVITPTITTTDTDGDTIIFSLAGPDAGEFVIDGAATDQPVVIKTARMFDYDAGDTSFTFTIVAYDGTATTTSNAITLSINDLNDNAPACNPISYFITLAENSNVGDPVLTITGCTDPDAGTSLTYTESVTYPQFEFASSSFGAITLQAALDYEADTEHTLYMVISDGDVSHDQIVTVVVTVSNVNEGLPTYGSASYAASNLNEGLPVGTLITTSPAITATDADGDTITFSLAGADASKFAINGAASDQPVVIKVLSEFDYEAGDTSFTFTVHASDGIATVALASSLTVNINDLNDNPPVCNPISYFITLPESYNVGDPVVTITGCSDADAGTSLTYTESVAYPQFEFPSATSGAITLQAALDYETDTEHTLYMVISDGDVSHDQTATVVVTVNPVNEGVPTYGSAAYAATNLDEGLPVGTDITISPAITATDADGDTITFSLGGADAAEFVISGAATDQPVVIKTARAFDFEGGDTSFAFNIGANDGISTVTSNTITLTINDLNDNEPVCNPSSYFATLPENHNVGDPVVSITGCTDADAGTSLTYVESIAYPQFQIPVSTSGAITLQAALDYETDTDHTLYVIVSDGTVANDKTATVFITVTPVNEASPVWAATYGPYNVDEDQTLGATVTTISATDTDAGDDGEIEYVITGITGSDTSSGAGKFHLDQGSGLLTLSSALERDPSNSGVQWYDVVAQAQDGGTPANVATQTIRINVVDVNDEAPAFGSLPYSVTVNEGDPANTLIQTLSCPDGRPNSDPDITYSVSYAIQSGDPGYVFQLGGGGNEIQVQTAIDLDAGDGNFYSLVVTCSDGGTPALTGTATVYIHVVSVNDADPAFGTTTPSGAIPLSENSAVGYSVATVTATDSDWGADGEIEYSISGGDDDDNFIIDKTSGLIELKTRVDFETATNNPVLLEVKASDKGTPVRTSTIVLTINIGDENDNSPICTEYTYTEEPLETIATATTIVTLACTDSDATDTVTYSIISGNTNNDFVVSAAGVVTNANALDYDSANKFYNLVVRPTDGTNYVDVTIAVNVQAVNEDTPTYATDPNLPFSETTAVGTTMTTYAATDNDHSPHDIVSYTMTGGGDVFNIDSSTAEITLAQALDYDVAPTSYELVVTATDGGGLAGSGTVTIAIQDANDNTPVCNPMTHILTQNENSGSAPDTLVADMVCTDADGSAGFGTASLSYAITQTPAGSEFSVAAGVLISNVLDYETSHSYSLTVTVADGGGLSCEVPISVIVGAVNEGGPAFSGVFSQNILETTAVGTSVDDVTATDPDDSSHPDGELIYTITAGNTNGKFNVDPGTGEVKVNGLLDRETTAQYLLEVMATEAGGTNSASTTLTVNIDDVDDNVPTCTNNPFSVAVNEDEGTSFTVITLGCSDPDSSSTLVYTITTGDTAIFGMTGDTLQLVGGLDYDAGTRQHNLEITVNDGTNSIVVSGAVTVNPINEAVPIFTATTYPQNVNENTAVNTVVETVIANDADSADYVHGQVIYSVVSGATPMFEVNSANGDIILAGKLNRETTASYTMQIQATDSTNVATATVIITVIDDNDNAPVFSPRQYSHTMSESTSAVAAVLTVAATDADDPGTTDNGVIAYSISGGNTGSAFAIDATTGAITMVGILDIETTASYTLIILAEDLNGGAGALSDTATVIITITGENEADPAFGSILYSSTIPEDSSLGDVVTTIAATDADDGADGDVFYALAAASAEFYLDSETGIVTVKSVLNYEIATNYALTVHAIDRGTPARTGTSSVTVTITDVNDVTPDCVPRTYLANLREDDVITTPVATLACTDPEPGANGNLLYTIVTVNGAAGTGPFTIDAAGAVTLNAALDYESTASYSVQVEVKDGGAPSLSTIAQVSVTVADVNEADPLFTAQPASQNVPENTAVGTTINTITATDADVTNALTYSFNPASTRFDIDATTGEILLKSELDRETQASYTLNVVATDNGLVDAIRSAIHVFTITVADANDGPPVFAPASYVATTRENSAAGTTVTTVTASDADEGANGAFTYSIESGNTGNVFRVDQVSSVYGEIIIDDITNLDYETTTSYNLEVIAIDGGMATSTTTVAVNIEPYNEADPTFTPGPTFSSNWAENTALGTVLDTVAAGDADRSTQGDGQFHFFIQGPAGITTTFGINAATGEVKLVGPLDRETASTHSIEVIAVDYGVAVTGGARTGTATVSITVDDINDVTPLFNPTFYLSTLQEDVATTTNVAALVCTDTDSTVTNNVLTYSIASGNGGGEFTINPSTGVVTTVAAPGFDYETTKTYTLVVETADSGTPSLTGTGTIQIQITGINEHIPVFGSDPYTVNVNEDGSVNDNVQLVTATDADDPASVDGTFIYSIFAGNTGNKFAIDAGSGQIKLISLLDFETLTAYDLIIYATDSGTNPGAYTGSTTVSITVVDVNDNTPSCTASFHATTLDENSVASTAVYTPVCTDADSSPLGDITYSITSGNTGSAFAIDATTAAITVATPAVLDAETNPSFSLVVTAADGGTPSKSATLNIEITLNNLNEANPAFSQASYTANVNEAEAAGYSVITVTATDVDTGVNGQVEFSITGGNTGNSFFLNPTTGELFVQGALDRETTASYTLDIQAADKPTNPGDVLTDTATITITIADENDNTPICPSTPYTSTQLESVPSGTLIASVVCTDADTGVNNIQTYSITSGNVEGKFVISSVTGVVTLAAGLQLDYETTTAYTLTVEAADAGTPAKTGTAVVMVTVAPVNEHSPAITVPAGGYVPTVSEAAVLGTVVETVVGTDADNPAHEHGVIRWSITAGNTQSRFAIDTNTGVITLNAGLDRENTATYTLTVQATDSSVANGDQLTDTTAVVVTVTDENDNFPVSQPVSHALSVMEGAATGSVLYTYVIVDDDDGVNAQYDLAITAGNAEGKFAINGDDLELIAALDYETTQQFRLTVSVTDRGTPALTTNAYITVNVVSENEHPPVFAVDTDAVSFAEDIAIGATIYDADATDTDLGDYGELHYTIIDGNPDDATFLIDVDTGVIITGSFMDYDIAPNSYVLNISVTDNDGVIGPSNKYDFMTLTVTLTDVNDNVPVFTMNTYSQSINEDVGSNQPVITVIANDADSLLNGDVQYSIDSGDGVGHFVIDASTGAITTDPAQTLNYDVKPSYTLVIKAEDQGTPSKHSYSIVRISLNDVNDNPPVFNPADFIVAVTEEQAPGAFVANLYATDADAGANGVMAMSIVAGNGAGDLRMTQTSNNDAVIEADVSLDRETTSMYILIIEAVDNGFPVLTGTATVTIQVTDINDNDPVIQNLPYNSGVLENVPIGHTVMTITATDADDGQNAELSYSITGGDLGDFEILADYGRIKSKVVLDRESRPLYKMVIEVTDKATPARTATTTTTLSITDVNDNNPVFVTFGPYYVQENVNNLTHVGAVVCSDADEGINAVVQYSIIETSDGTAEHFLIEADTGVLRSAAELDRETVDMYNLLIRCKDDAAVPLYSDRLVTIFVTDHNDQRPTCEQGTMTINVAENQAAGIFIGDINATDIDLGANGHMTYSISSSSPASAFFDVGAADGKLSLKQTVDRETNAHFEFDVDVTDDGGDAALSGVCHVVVNIVDQNDNSPVFDKSYYSHEIAFNEPRNYFIGQLRATDADYGLNGQIQYSLYEETDDFAVGYTSGNLTKKSSSDFAPSEKHLLTVVARDSGPGSTNSASVNARVDTFPPNSVVVSFDMRLTASLWQGKETDFSTKLKATLNSRYQNNVVNVWKIIEDPTRTTLSSNRRKLLQEQGIVQPYITAAVYAVANDITYTAAGVNDAKEFIAAAELLAIWQGDPDTEAPSSAVTGEDFDEYAITHVRQYYSEDDKPWYEQTVWIIVMACCGAGLLLLIIILVLVIVFCCRRKKRNTRVDETEERARVDEDRKTGKHGQPAPSVLLMPVPEKKHGPTNNIFVTNPWEERKEVPRQASTSSPGGSKKQMEKGNMPPPERGRSFYDGRAVDPITGKTYEYNSLTGERRWVKTTNHT